MLQLRARGEIDSSRDDVMRSVRSFDERILDAEVRCNQALADGNAAQEAGDRIKAEKLYAGSQRWLDTYNRLVKRRRIERSKK